MASQSLQRTKIGGERAWRGGKETLRGNGGGGGTKVETGDSCPTKSAADGSMVIVKGFVPAAFM
uniref:Uncharacterized protein n=1 Tax=Leersia perrieri TaxID=77586 RepID=A0A0D9XTZ3_9ORYZ